LGRCSPDHLLKSFIIVFFIGAGFGLPFFVIKEHKMALKIDSVEKVAVTSTAKDIEINYRAFMIENLATDQVAYIKEKAEDNKACTASNGFAIPAGKVFDKVMRAKTLSIIGSGAADVRIMYVVEDE